MISYSVPVGPIVLSWNDWNDELQIKEYFLDFDDGPIFVPWTAYRQSKAIKAVKMDIEKLSISPNPNPMQLEIAKIVLAKLEAMPRPFWN